MPLWLGFVDGVRGLLVLVSQLFGGNIGGGIVAVSVLVRLVMMPLAIRTAVRMAEARRKLEEAKPELDAIRRRHAKDPKRMHEETLALYRRRNIALLPSAMLTQLIVQLPIGLGVYQAIRTGLDMSSRWLWVRDLARPDAAVALVAGALAGGAAASSPGANQVTITLAVAVAVGVVWTMSAGLGLYMASSSAVGIVEGYMIRRAIRVATQTPTSSG